jgi:hypothetical protein
LLRSIGYGRAIQAAVAPDATLLAVATSAGLAWLELPTLRHLRFDAVEGGVDQVAFSPDGQTVIINWAVDSNDARSELRRVADGAVVTTLEGQAKPIFWPDGQVSSS